MTRYYCSYFDRNYLVKALALIDSLRRHEPDFRLYAVCLDEITRLVLEELAMPGVVTIPMHDIEYRDTALLNAKQNRSAVEYYWTTTPTVILRVMERHPEIDVLTYLDADLYFSSSPDPIFEELGASSVLVHEHRFSPDLAHLVANGKYNVGLLCFRNDARGLAVLKWWRDRCNEWCYDRVEDGKYGDQLYLDSWPRQFDGVTVLQHVGAGVAPWNHVQYTYGTDAMGQVLVNGRPLILYHFHALALVNPEVAVASKHVHYFQTLDTLRYCFVPYLEALHRAITTIRTVLPSFDFGYVEQALTPETVFLVRDGAPVPEGPWQDLAPIELGSGWRAYYTLQLRELKDLASQIQGLLQHDQEREALALTEGALESYPGSPDLLNLLAELRFRAGQTEEAAAMLRNLVERWPNHSPAHNNLSVVLWTQGLEQEALRHVAQAVTANPSNRDAIINAGELLAAMGLVEDAKHIYSVYLALNPRDTLAMETNEALGITIGELLRS